MQNSFLEFIFLRWICPTEINFDYAKLYSPQLLGVLRIATQTLPWVTQTSPTENILVLSKLVLRNWNFILYKTSSLKSVSIEKKPLQVKPGVISGIPTEWAHRLSKMLGVEAMYWRTLICFSVFACSYLSTCPFRINIHLLHDLPTTYTPIALHFGFLMEARFGKL